MDECNPFPQSCALSLDSPYCNQLDIECFSLMMKDPTYCYKFYWLEAIVKLIDENFERATFDAIIDEMIANAWYTVLEYHVHLSGMLKGEFRDALELVIIELAAKSELPSNASKIEIKKAIEQFNVDIKKYKIVLTKYVPYRALAGFYNRYEQGGGAKVNWNSTSAVVDYTQTVNHRILLPYTFDENSQLSRTVIFNPVWKQYIQDNSVALLGWIQHEKSKWLQVNNPEVPGIVYKLSPMDACARKLEQVRKLWEIILQRETILDIYTNKPIESEYDIDHFIPWSFVMNDELWNLIPMDSSLNSSKCNRLPHWMFFNRFADNQYEMYRLMWEDEYVRSRFEKCYRDNIHSIWAETELFKPGNSKKEFVNILQKNMQPVYDSARRQGYEIWKFEG